MPETDPIIFQLQELRAQLDELRRNEYARYVAGTWTPTFSGSSTAGVYTYVTQAGPYWTIGGLVFIVGDIQISAIGTPPVGTMRIAGLPYTSAAYLNSIYFGKIGNFNYAAAAMDLTADIATSSALIRLIESFDNSADVAAPAANFTNVDCHLEFSGFYARA